MAPHIDSRGSSNPACTSLTRFVEGSSSQGGWPVILSLLHCPSPAEEGSAESSLVQEDGHGRHKAPDIGRLRLFGASNPLEYTMYQAKTVQVNKAGDSSRHGGKD